MSDTASRQSGSSNASTKEPKRLVKGAVEGTKHPSSFSASARIIGKVNKWQIEFPTRRNHYYIFEYAKINHGATLYDDTAQEDITLKDQYLRILKSTLDDGMDVEDVSSNLQKIVSKATQYSQQFKNLVYQVTGNSNGQGRNIIDALFNLVVHEIENAERTTEATPESSGEAEGVQEQCRFSRGCFHAINCGGSSAKNPVNVFFWETVDTGESLDAILHYHTPDNTIQLEFDGKSHISFSAIVGEAEDRVSVSDEKYFYVFKHMARQLTYASEGYGLLTTRDHFYCMKVQIPTGDSSNLLVYSQSFSCSEFKSGKKVFKWENHAKVCAVLHKFLLSVREMKIHEKVEANDVFVRNFQDLKTFVGPVNKKKPFDDSAKLLEWPNLPSDINARPQNSKEKKM